MTKKMLIVILLASVLQGCYATTTGFAMPTCDLRSDNLESKLHCLASESVYFTPIKDPDA